jgi:hypothetical protein
MSSVRVRRGLLSGLAGEWSTRENSMRECCCSAW